jgi:ubiquinone/menaquinone biosynthesis C-methylase UbiE
MPDRSGSYPIARRAGEIERLRVQAAAMEFDAGVLLERIGVGPGWRCLDLGCGPGALLPLLSARVGPTGRVVGLDADPAMLDAARGWVEARGLGNVELAEADAYRTGLPGDAFDLVHVRYLAGTAGQPGALLTEAIRLARPGGVVAFQEPDTDTLACHPGHPAWDRLKTALQEGFACVGADTRLAKRLYRLFREAGLRDVRYRPFLVGVTSAEPMADYLPATIESIRGTLIDRGLVPEAELDDALAACRRHLADPDTVSTSFLTAQVWGRKAAAPGEGFPRPSGDGA